MKKAFTLLLFVVVFGVSKNAKAQWVNTLTPNFAYWISVNYPGAINANNELDTTNAFVLSATSITIGYGWSLSDLTGIQYFKSLTSLDCSNCGLFNLSNQLPASLQFLYCQNNQLNSLPPLPWGLYVLNCSNNQLTSLPSLGYWLGQLDCSHNQISNLPTMNTQIQKLYCQNNQLTALPPFINTSLINLNCSYNQLTAIPTLPASLISLLCSNNLLDSILTQTYPSTYNLTYLDCSYNNISLINFSNTDNPDTFYCQHNQLTGFRLGSNNSLVNCSYNLLDTVIVPNNNSNLVTFICNNNLLKTLSISSHFLSDVICNNNLLNRFSTHGNVLNLLHTLDCSYNNLTYLYLPIGIQNFYCQHNQLDSIYFPITQSNSIVNCSYNKLKRIGTLSMFLYSLNCSSNPIVSLPNFNSNTITYLICDSTKINALPSLVNSIATLSLIADSNLYCLPDLKNVSSLNITNTPISCLPNRGHLAGSWLTFPLCQTGNSNACSVLCPNASRDTITQNICSPASYHFFGRTLTQSGVYHDTLVNYLHCDSIVTLNLTVGSSSSLLLTQTTCNSFTFYNKTLTHSGVYYDTLTNYVGCDSIITLNLTLLNDSVNIYKTACTSYSFHNQTLTQSGIYYDTLTNYHNCDSLIVLHLLLGHPSGSINNQSICANSSFPFHNQTLTQSGTYYDTLVNYTGCDSIITLSLQVKFISVDSQLQTICSNQTYVFNNQALNLSGRYVDTLQNYVGCDSFVILHLKVISTSASNFNLSICAGSSYVFNHQTLTQGGFYYDTLTNYHGCDSIITLYLTVKPAITDSFAVAICSNRSYLFGGHSLTSAGYYSDTLNSYQSCDSIITLHLTINPTQASAYNYTACSNQPYVFNGHTLIAAGTYVDTMHTYLGCDSVVTLTLSINAAPTALFTLYPDTPILHHWLALNQCTGTAPLTYSWSWGDASANDTGTTPSHIYAAAGGYNVCVSVTDANNCTATFCDSSYLSRMNSANSVVTINVVSSLPSGILTINENALQIYPNPTNHETVVSLQHIVNNASIKLTNIIGQTIFEKTNQSGNQFTLDLSNEAKGIYFIEIKQTGNVWRGKVVKE